MISKKYIGSELRLFSKAKNWKGYYKELLQPYIGKRVLEVGAGIGATTEVLCKNGNYKEWVCLEPDSSLLSEVERKICTGILPDFCSSYEGNISIFRNKKKFDTILYIDVLEHIELDDQELLNASELLNEGGYLIVLSPAFNYLYSPFDQSIGHYRRYDKKLIKNFRLPQLRISKLIYLDSVGILTSLANKLFLKQDNPTPNQILFWDNWIVPFSKVVDKLILFSFGRSIMCVWIKK